MNKFALISSIIILNAFYGYSQKNEIISKFQNNKSLSNANISICVQNMEGKEIVSFNKNKSLTPASVLKLVTTATAMEALGKDYVYKTELILDKTDKSRLIIRGYGDPTLGSEYLFQDQKGFLEEWVARIKKQNFQTPLNICIADDYFGYQGTSTKWVREDLGNYYASGAYGVSIFDNTYRLFFNTMNTAEPPKILRTEPPVKNIKFLNTMQFNTSGQDNGFIWGEPFSNKRLLRGNIPAKKSSFYIKGDIPDPGLFLAETLSEILSSNGIEVNEITTTRKAYYENMYTLVPVLNNENKEMFYAHSSPALKDIIRVVNVRSNNHYAEHLIRTIGRKQNPDIYSEPLKEGINYIHAFWKGKRIDTGGLFMYDGSGLSPSNALNSALLCDMLRYMYTQSKNSDAFIASLPKTGKSGTVRNLLKGTKLEGKLLVKSGSIANVQCYAGYYIDGENEYVFAVMVNNFKPDTRKEVIKAIEAFLSEVF